MLTKGLISDTCTSVLVRLRNSFFFCIESNLFSVLLAWLAKYLNTVDLYRNHIYKGLKDTGCLNRKDNSKQVYSSFDSNTPLPQKDMRKKWLNEFAFNIWRMLELSFRHILNTAIVKLSDPDY